MRSTVPDLARGFWARTERSRHRRWKLLLGLMSMSAAASLYERHLLIGVGKDVLRTVLALKLGGKRAALRVLIPAAMQFMKTKRARKARQAPRKSGPPPRRA